MTTGLRMRLAAAGRFTPTDLPGLHLWLDASQLPVVADGTALSSWTDLSGGARHATQTGTLRPLYKTNIFGARPSVRFDGTDDYLEATGLSPGGSGELTLFAAFKINTPRSNGRSLACWLSTQANDFDNADTFILLHQGSELPMVYRNGVISAVATIPSGLQVYAIRFTGSQGRLWMGGGSTTGAGTSGAFGFNRYLVSCGRSGSAFADFMAIDHAEHILCTTSLDLPTIDRVGNYLAAKWGGTWTAAISV